jgi:serine/threonine-protein kinase
MICPSCNSPLESNARFCGVCGYRLAPNRTPGANSSATTAPFERLPPAGTPAPSHLPAATPAPSRPIAADRGHRPVSQATPGAALPNAKQPRIAVKPRKSGDEIYLNQVLNNRFKVESKIGEGGFGAVYRGLQLATGRKVALKLLHPEMTKDENLVARFRREGMVLCNLRDAHTITTYDFDQTPDGTLYIAMELLEGKSLHQLFHEEAPLDWKRVFKILTEMCSSLAEAHHQGIVHRDLKPENIYLETRSGNPEFVKILDFGIAKVMRGDTIDPQAPQLTATGQTLGTLEYMSPEQLMGKALDGRSDVYALGVLAYEMITGRLPFPDAKGPAGLITAQLKQTPLAPSLAQSKATLSRAADRVILKCLEKDKNNRYPDVTALAEALQDAVNQSAAGDFTDPSDAVVTLRRGDPHAATPPGALSHTPAPAAPGGLGGFGGSGPGAAGLADRSAGHPGPGGQLGNPGQASSAFPPPLAPAPHYPLAQSPPLGSMPQAIGRYAPATYPVLHRRMQSPKKIVWLVIALLAIGAGVGTAMALLFSK